VSVVPLSEESAVSVPLSDNQVCRTAVGHVGAQAIAWPVASVRVGTTSVPCCDGRSFLGYQITLARPGICESSSIGTAQFKKEYDVKHERTSDGAS
jgi:hypothetical protein